MNSLKTVLTVAVLSVPLSAAAVPLFVEQSTAKYIESLKRVEPSVKCHIEKSAWLIESKTFIMLSPKGQKTVFMILYDNCVRAGNVK